MAQLRLGESPTLARRRAAWLAEAPHHSSGAGCPWPAPEPEDLAPRFFEDGSLVTPCFSLAQARCASCGHPVSFIRYGNAADSWESWLEQWVHDADGLAWCGPSMTHSAAENAPLRVATFDAPKPWSESA